MVAVLTASAADFLLCLRLPGSPCCKLGALLTTRVSVCLKLPAVPRGPARHSTPLPSRSHPSAGSPLNLVTQFKWKQNRVEGEKKKKKVRVRPWWCQSGVNFAPHLVRKIGRRLFVNNGIHRREREVAADVLVCKCVCRQGALLSLAHPSLRADRTLRVEVSRARSTECSHSGPSYCLFPLTALHFSSGAAAAATMTVKSTKSPLLANKFISRARKS